MLADTTPVDDGALEAWGIHRLPVPVPFVDAGGPVNVYAIEDGDGRWTLFDAGVATVEGRAALKAEAARRGVDLTRLSRIIISHGHVDHFGNAQALAQGSGATVLVHPWDRGKVLGVDRYSDLVRGHRGYLEGLGVPSATIDEADEKLKAQPSLVVPVDADRLAPLEEGQRFEFRRFGATVIHTPGHTPGLVCLHAEAPRLLFADDHLLARVSPNPLLDLTHGAGPTKFRSLVSYVASARRVHALELDAVLPGHGEAFTGHRELLDGLFGFYGKRQAKLAARLAEHGPSTPYELLEVLFVRRDLGRLVLMLSEVLGNLEVMEQDGAVVRDVVDGVVRFAVAPR